MTPRPEKVLARADFDDATNYFMLQYAVIFGCTIILIPLLIIVLPIVLIVKTIEYRHIECVLLSRTLKVRRGWLNKTENTIPLDKITDLSVRQSLIMRWAGVEALTVETAGQSNMTGGALVQLVGIRGAREFRDIVLERRDLIAGYADDDHPSSVPTADTPTPSSLASGDTAATLAAIHQTLLRIEQRIDSDPRDAT